MRKDHKGLEKNKNNTNIYSIVNFTLPSPAMISLLVVYELRMENVKARAPKVVFL